MKIGRNEPCPCGSGKKWKRCHGDPNNYSGQSWPTEEFLAAAKSSRLPRIADILPQVSKLERALREFDAAKVISAAAALASLDCNHTFIFRLDTLIFLAAHCCAGDRTPSVHDLDRWLNQEVVASDVNRLEDPPEDFAVGIVSTGDGDRLIFNGSLSGPDAYLQDVLDTLMTGPDLVEPIRRSVMAALAVSDELVRRRGYSRFTTGKSGDGVTLPEDDEQLWRLISSQIISNSDIGRLALSEADLQPFVCAPDDVRTTALDQQIVHSRGKFLVRLGDVYLIAFPTSIADAVIAYVLAQLDRLNTLRTFGAAITKTQAHRLFEAAMHPFHRDDIVRTGNDLDKRGNRPPGISEIAFHLDGNKYLHVVIVHDDMEAAHSSGLDETWIPAANAAVSEHFERIATTLRQRTGTEGGLTLVVMAGIGRAYQIAIPTTLPAGCFLQVWSQFDFECLVWLESDWPMMLWKLCQQRKILSGYGIEFVSPDDATLYGHWRGRSYRLIPEMALDRGQTLIEVSCNEVLPLRERARRGHDSHSIYRPDRREWVRVCRTAPSSYFKEDEERPRYESPERAGMGFLEGVIESPVRAWWIDCGSTRNAGVDRRFLYKLWKTGQVWLERVVPTLEEKLGGLPRQNLVITLDTSEITAMTDWTESTISRIPPVAAYSVRLNEHGFAIFLPTAFIAMGRNPENLAERLLAEAMVRGAVLCAGLTRPDECVAEIMEGLAISGAERHMHMFVAIDHRDHLRAFTSDDPQLLKDADLYFAPAGIGYEVGLGPTIISDQNECHELLNKIVDAYWSRCRACLARINRKSLVIRCLKNNEALHAEQDNWIRTRRAVVALHADQADVLRASQRAREQMDRTQISHRIIVEMAICTCTENGGREATQEDIDYLGAQILQLMAAAQESDAMRAGAIPAWIRVSLAGDIRLASDFSELMRPYLSGHFEITHRRDIDEYERNFTLPKYGTKTEEEAFGPAFVAAFREEYGISPMRLAEASRVLAEDAYSAKTDVMVRTKDSLMSLLSDEGGFERTELDGLMDHFVLPVRANWAETSPPFRGKDWWPWRYRRRLSVMARPLIAINDTEIAFAPAFCEDAFRHVIMEAYTGAFETEYFASQSMKEYIGAENRRRGLAFNKSVAEAFATAGWRVEIELQMTHLQAPQKDASGDIDVLAVKDGTVYVCECKELLFARTITEVVEQLGRFRGDPGDALWKHVRRVEWVRSHPQRLSKVIGQEPREIRSLLVTSKIVPMQFAKGFPVEVIAIDSLRTIFK